jgi:hypothetical protein
VVNWDATGGFKGGDGFSKILAGLTSTKSININKEPDEQGRRSRFHEVKISTTAEKKKVLILFFLCCYYFLNHSVFNIFLKV